MRKVFQKIILLIAVLTVTAHNVFPHFHFDDIIAYVQQEHHHHDDSKHQHDTTTDMNGHQNNPFSFAQLDNEFIPANGQANKVEQPVQYLPALIVVLLPGNDLICSKPKFGRYIEYPPPNGYYHNLPSRAPPASFVS